MTLPGTFDNMKTIQLTQGKVAIVDDDDFEMLNAYKWFAHKQGDRFYARRNTSIRNGAKRTAIGMHRVIMRTPVGFETDHVNGDGLDNRRDNLRIATSSQNKMNRGSRRDNKLGVKGVSRSRGRFRAVIQINGNYKLIGVFLTIEAASAAYQLAAQKLFGEFAHVA